MPKIKKVIEVEVPHRVGNLYWSDKLNCYCILAQIGPCVVSLIGLDDTANRVLDGITVGSTRNITDDEFDSIRGSFDMDLEGLWSDVHVEDELDD